MYLCYATQFLGQRRMRKEGTDVGWRLRADLHHDGDPGSSLLGRRLRGGSLSRRAAEPRPSATAPGWEHREVSRPQVNASREEVLWSGRPSGRCDPIRVLVACGQGKPCARRKSLARAHKETSTAGAMQVIPACGAGGEEMPCRHPSHPLRRSATRRGRPHSSTRVRPSGSALRCFGYERSGGSRPQRWGTAADEEQTFEGCGAGGDEDLVRAIFGW
jgi:hypothetical protein